MKNKVLQNLIMINASFKTCKSAYQKTFWIINWNIIDLSKHWIKHMQAILEICLEDEEVYVFKHMPMEVQLKWFYISSLHASLTLIMSRFWYLPD